MINNNAIKLSNKILKDFRTSRKAFYEILNTEFYDAIFNYNVKQIESHYNQLQVYFEETVKLYHILTSDFNKSNINNFMEGYKKCIDYFDEQYCEESEKIDLYIKENISQNKPLLRRHIKAMDDCICSLYHYDFKKIYIQQETLFKKALYDMNFMVYKNLIDLMDEYCKYCNELLNELKRLLKLALKEYEKIIKSNEDIDTEEEYNTETQSNNTLKYDKIFKYKDFQKLLTQKGFKFERQTGGHEIYKKDSKTIVLPIHSKELKKGISISIQKSINDIEDMDG